MQIDFKFHNFESSDALKTYATDKIGKLQKYVRAPLEVHITFSLERISHRVDVTFNAGPEHHQAHAEESEMYAAIDAVVDKIQRQINRSKDQHHNHRRGPLPEDAAGE